MALICIPESIDAISSQIGWICHKRKWSTVKVRCITYGSFILGKANKCFDFSTNHTQIRTSYDFVTVVFTAVPTLRVHVSMHAQRFSFRSQMSIPPPRFVRKFVRCEPIEKSPFFHIGSYMKSEHHMRHWSHRNVLVNDITFVFHQAEFHLMLITYSYFPVMHYNCCFGLDPFSIPKWLWHFFRFYFNNYHPYLHNGKSTIDTNVAHSSLMWCEISILFACEYERATNVRRHTHTRNAIRSVADMRARVARVMQIYRNFMWMEMDIRFPVSIHCIGHFFPAHIAMSHSGATQQTENFTPKAEKSTEKLWNVECEKKAITVEAMAYVENKKKPANLLLSSIFQGTYTEGEARARLSNQYQTQLYVFFSSSDCIDKKEAVIFTWALKKKRAKSPYLKPTYVFHTHKHTVDFTFAKLDLSIEISTRNKRFRS